ncbi:unnamed protein product [Ectocarpus sp. 13 AM-2016]
MSTAADEGKPKVAATTPPSSTSTRRKTALDFNLPKGDNFFLNSRKQRLHLRTFLPETGVEMKALLFWYHGYAAHINGPTFREFAEGMSAGGYAVIAVDQHGHGYSDGATVLMNDYKHLLEDNIAILDVVTRGTPDGERSNLGLDPDIRDKMTQLPFFFGGQSLGGGLSLLMAMQLKNDTTRPNVGARLLGVMANCPAIRANPPKEPVLFLLKHVVAPLFPSRQIPRFMEKVSVPELVWLKSEHVEMGALDKVGQPGGLGWPGTMRFGTGSQLIDMLGELYSRLSEVDFPFLVLHDPEDGIVRFEGTQKLLDEASTPADVPRGKEVKEMLGLKHDLLSNATTQMLAAYTDWGAARLEAGAQQLT